MSGQPGFPGGQMGSPLMTADGRPMELSVSQSQMRALSQVLKPGEIVTGRVVERFAGGNYLFTLRGRNMIAESAVPLARDSAVQFKVLGAKDGVQLKLLTPPAPGDRAITSDAGARLAQLNLPATPQAAMVLQAFEQANAPLGDGQRLRQALGDILRLPVAVNSASQAGNTLGKPQGNGTSGPAVQTATSPVLSLPAPEALARAHAVLAQRALPATPALLSLALRSGEPQLPNPLGALSHPLGGLSRSGEVKVAGQSGALPKAPAQTQGAHPNPALPQSARPAAQVAVPASAVPPSPQPATTVAPQAAAPAATSQPPASPTPGQQQSPVPATGMPQHGTTLVNGTPIFMPNSGGNTPVFGQPGPAFALSGNPQVIADQVLPQAGVRPAVTEAELLQRIHQGLSPEGRAIDETSRPRGEASIQALQGDAPVDERQSLILRQIQDQFQASEGGRQLATAAARELLAEQTFKPAHLQDYDHVVPLPLTDQGRPQPARIAVSQRHAGTQEATFVRVDAELDELGPVSIRMSEAGAGPIAITLMATGKGIGSLEQGLEDLNKDLKALGLDAAVRLLPFDEEQA